LILGTIIRKKAHGEDTKLGRVGIALQFLAQITLGLNLLLAMIGPSFWHVFFDTFWAIGWLFLLITVPYGIIFGKRSFEIIFQTQEENFGIGSFWGLFVLLTIIIVVIYGVCYVSWASISFFIDLFRQIAIRG
jgi:hypothetical protein